MPLKTLVKVGSITNLSDARYCAGMGVDMLGFSVVPGHPSYIPIPLFQQIRGWVSGPKVVAEMYGLTDASEIKSVIDHYVPDFAEMTFSEYTQFKSSIKLPLIVYLAQEEVEHLRGSHPEVRYWIVDEHGAQRLGSFLASTPILLKVSSKIDIEQLGVNRALKGVVLSGSPEVRPGYKNYDDLADVLEALEEE